MSHLIQAEADYRTWAYNVHVSRRESQLYGVQPTQCVKRLVLCAIVWSMTCATSSRKIWSSSAASSLRIRPFSTFISSEREHHSLKSLKTLAADDFIEIRKKKHFSSIWHQPSRSNCSFLTPTQKNESWAKIKISFLVFAKLVALSSFCC